jgi:ATP-dependent Lon protease
MTTTHESITQLPILPLKDSIILPYSIAPIFVGRHQSLQAIEHALQHQKEIVIVSQRNGATEIPQPEDLFTIGIRASILQVMRMPKNALKVLVEGMHRTALTEVVPHEGFLMGLCKDIPDQGITEENDIYALWRNFISLYKQYASANSKMPIAHELLNPSKSIEGIIVAVDTLAIHCNLSVHERQTILEETNLKERLLKLCTFLQKEIDITETEKRISNQVQMQIERNQREYYLNEQLKVINKELGRNDDLADIIALRAKADSLKLPAEAAEKVTSEIKRLEQMAQFSPEAAVSRNYIEWIFSLPWNAMSSDAVSIEEAEKILNHKHAGLQKPKERILEFIAAKKFNPDIKSPIICLMGPPGVGKTSLGSSIAEALGREFIRISLGGVRDEAEIRGHRRTYIGALPGKFIQAMKKAKTMNPVILLDEIDKMSLDYHGDPASALLEVLDPEQNSTFVDNYLDLGYDLSKVMFVATANHPDGIPFPLFDRMEVINLSGYTDQEKLEIAEKFLIPKNLKNHGLTPQRCKFEDGVLHHVITNYTKEAGVRSLERIIAKLIRKAVQHLLSHEKQKTLRITQERCLTWLGPAPFKKRNLETEKNGIGCATGLAWTEVGGDVLEIETTTVPGKGELTLTGQLGDVMQESAQAALSYIRSRSKEFGIKKTFFSTHDIHVHIPEGATPKDGPSAGITMCAALISTLVNAPLKPAVAMTGEITLRGRVLPVGGLKEKILAAQQHGIKTIFVPDENKEEVLKIKKEFSYDIDIRFVKTMDEVLVQTFSRFPSVLPVQSKVKTKSQRKNS